MYPELALALPFVFLGIKMNFKMRLIFLGATLLSGGVLMGFHIGRVSVQQEMSDQRQQDRQNLHPRGRSNEENGGGGEARVLGGQRSPRKEMDQGRRTNNTWQGNLPLDDFKTKIAREAEEVMLRRGVKVMEQKQEAVDDGFLQTISLSPRKQHQPQANKQGAEAPGNIPVHPANQNALPPAHQPAIQQQLSANQNIGNRPGDPQPPNQKQPVAPQRPAAAAGKRQSIHYAYEPFDILPEPEPLDSVGVEPVNDVFGTQLLPYRECIHLSVVVCGDRTEETTIMLKSAAVLTKACLVFHIFAEDDLQAGIRDLLNTWPESFRSRIHLYVYPITYPTSEDEKQWKKVFKLCATQRLFLPGLLPNVDSLLYVDTDILFIRPLEKIWHFFSQFNTSQMAALSPEHELPNIGWYNRFARHPYYGKTGLNSGVMLMNLTRMREFRWINRVIPFYRQYQYKITWGDQDVINILFYFHPDKVLQYPCEWNYRPDHCMYGNNCPRIESVGISVIHGNRGVYHNEKQLPFRSIYETYRDFHFGGSISSDLVQPLKEKWMNSNLANMYCTKALKKPILSTLKEVHATMT